MRRWSVICNLTQPFFLFFLFVIKLYDCLKHEETVWFSSGGSIDGRRPILIQANESVSFVVFGWADFYFEGCILIDGEL
jgi:hypothetical protein